MTKGRRQSYLSVAVATGVAGAAGFAGTSVVAAVTGPASYALFAVFWSTLYLLIAALSGIQQEVTRGTHRAEFAETRVSRARNFALIASGAVVVAIVGSAGLWAERAFAPEGWGLVWPLAVGAGSYVLVATLCGSLFGIREWLPLALMIAVDGILRLVSLLVVLRFTTDLVALAWATALPFPLTIAVLWLFIRRAIVGRTELDVGYGQLVWNAARTVVAAASTGLLVSGFPLVLGVTSASENPADLGVLILAVTLVRAPVVVTVISLQGYLLVQFRDHIDRFWPYFLRVLGAIAALSGVLAAVGALIGPAVFVGLFGSEYRIYGPLVAVIIASSALVASLCVSGVAVLAASRHLSYSAGWVVAAVATVASLLLPLTLDERVVTALIAGPSLGLAVHIVDLVRQPSRRGASAGADETP